MRTPKTVPYIIIFSIAIVVLLVTVGTVVLLIMGIGHYDQYLAKKLDNEHINSNYKNWTSVSFFETTKVYVPEDWHITQEEAVYYIADQEGRIFAYSAFIEKDGSQYQDASAFLSELVSFEVTDIEKVYPSNILSFGNAYCIQAKVCGDTQSEVFYYLSFVDDGCNCLLVFPSDNEADRDNLMEILEAIIYSYQFGDFSKGDVSHRWGQGQGDGSPVSSK